MSARDNAVHNPSDDRSVTSGEVEKLGIVITRIIIVAFEDSTRVLAMIYNNLIIRARYERDIN